MLKENRIAFKEWASVVSVLACGAQILILRKGGIREETGKFRMEHDEFFLFPTYEHQDQADLKPEAHPDFDAAIKRKPPLPLSELQISYYVQAVGALEITDESDLDRLASFHLWSDQAVKKRFHFGRDKGLLTIGVRVFRLQKPHVVPIIPEYGGCKSWVYLEKALKTEGARPVLPEANFARKWSEISSKFPHRFVRNYL